MAKTNTPSNQVGVATPSEIQEELQQLQQQVTQAQESERRALADYQNLIKRTQEQQLKMVKFANRELVSALLQPLEHLDLAAAQIHDQGLDMVVKQLQQVLEQAGLQEINALNQPFDAFTMEAVERGELGKKVTKVMRKGYRFQGEVIQPAKVTVD